MTIESNGKAAINPLPLRSLVHKATLSFKGMPSRSKADKAEARMIEQRESMAEGSFSATKALIGKDALAVIDAAKKELTDYYYDHSVAPSEGKCGFRLVPNKQLSEFTMNMNTLKRHCEDAFKEFLREYGKDDPAKHQAWLSLQQTRLGGKFDASEYPTPSDLERKFKIATGTESFTDISESAGQWVDGETLTVLKRQEEEMHQVVRDYASLDVWERVTTPLKAMVERLSDAQEGDSVNKDGQKSFKDSLVENLRDIATRLPDLDFQGDVRLEGVRKECLSMLEGLTAKELRKDGKKRKATATRAAAILKAGEGYGS